MLIEEEKSPREGTKFDTLKKTQSLDKLISQEDPFEKGKNIGNF